jgi:hypothetical protein
MFVGTSELPDHPAICEFEFPLKSQNQTQKNEMMMPCLAFRTGFCESAIDALVLRIIHGAKAGSFGDYAVSSEAIEIRPR